MKSSEPPDPAKVITGILTKKYGDYVLHMLKCKSVDEAFQLMHRISFVSGDTLETLRTPNNITPFVVKDENGKWVQVEIGGQFTKDQTVEVRRVASELRIPCESMCVANEGTLTQREFVLAMLELKNTKPAQPKKWWEIWK
jgi:hypothetical protein